MHCYITDIALQASEADFSCHQIGPAEVAGTMRRSCIHSMRMCD